MSIPPGWDLTNHIECCGGNTLIVLVLGFPEWGSWWRDGLLGEDTWLSRKRVREWQRRNKIDGPCLCVDWLGDRWVVFIRMVMVLPLSLLFSSLPALRSFSIYCSRFWPGWFTLGGIWHFRGDTHLSRYPTLSSLSTIHNTEQWCSTVIIISYFIISYYINIEYSTGVLHVFWNHALHYVVF